MRRLKDGIEVFPRQDRLEEGEYGNALRAPLGVHRKTNLRYWFRAAAPRPEAQLAYLNGLPKLTEDRLKALIHGMSFPEAYKPAVAPTYIPIAFPPGQREFRILEHVRITRKDSRNWWAKWPSCTLVVAIALATTFQSRSRTHAFTSAGPAAQRMKSLGAWPTDSHEASGVENIDSPEIEHMSTQPDGKEQSMSKCVNNVILMGHAGKDPQVHILPGGTLVNLSLATSALQRHPRRQERTEWHNLVGYQRVGEVLRDYVRKGSRLYIEGALRTRPGTTGRLASAVIAQRSS